MKSALRLLPALEAEIEAMERPLAETVLGDARVRHLMTIPGVGLVTALAIVAVIGDVRHFPRPNQLVGYLGLDPRVRQSGERLARIGHISRQSQALLRTVALGDCGRPYGTPRVHEHACVRCPFLRIDPAQLPRLHDIDSNTRARLDEARQKAWLGEVAALKESVAHIGRKRSQALELLGQNNSPGDAT